MTHRNHSVEQMRVHASEVARIDFVALPQPERDRLENEYRAEWDAITDTTSNEANKLKLAIYANLLDADDNADRINESAWILSHVRETQVLINAISPGALFVKDAEGNIINRGEDDKYGPRTRDCVKALFGINLPIPSLPIAPGAVIAEAGDEEISIDLPACLGSEAEARAVIAALGIEGVRVENGKLVGINELNTQRKIEQLCKYLDYANYLETGNTDAEGLIRRYKELLDFSTNFIEDKKYLIMKYASAIYEKIIDAGCIVRQNGVDGEYNITEIATGEIVSNSAYKDFVTGADAHKEYIEFARLNAIVGHKSSYWKERMVTRQGLVEYILQNNSIVADCLEKAGITKDLQSIESLLLNKDEVIRQLKTKADEVATGNDTSSPQFQELIWLLDFLEHEHYKQDDIQQSLFNNINHYNKVFQNEHSFIDALTAEGINPETADPNDETVIDSIQRVLGKNTIPLALLGIFTMIFGGKHKGKGFWLLAGLFGAKVGLGIAESTMEEVQDVRDDGEIIGDAFDMFDPSKIRHRINYEAGFEKESYDPTLTALYDANDLRQEQGEINNGMTQKLTNNAKIALIFQEILKKDNLMQIDLSDADTSTLPGHILEHMGIKEVTESTFPPRVPEVQRGDVSEDDIRVFLELLRGQAEEGETTIGEMLYADGESLATTSFENVDYTIDDVFDTKLNTTLRDSWNSFTPSSTITLAHSSKSRTALSEASGMMDNALKADLFDGLMDDIINRDLENIRGNLALRVAGIEDLKTNLAGISHLPADVKTSLELTLDSYIQFLKADEKISEIDAQDGWWAQTKTTIDNLLSGNSTEQNLAENISLLEDMLSKLDLTAFDIGGETINLNEALFVSLKTRIETLRDEITRKKSELETKLTAERDGRNHDLRNPDTTRSIGTYTPDIISDKLLDAENGSRFESISLDIVAAIEQVKVAYQSFESTGFSDTTMILPEHENALRLLLGTWGIMQGETYSGNEHASKAYIKTQLAPLFESAGIMENIPTKLSEGFNAYFSENKAVVDTQIDSISLTGTETIDEINAHLSTLGQIERRYKDKISSFEGFAVWIGTRPTPKSDFEIGVNDAREVFGTGISVTNTEFTAYKVSEAAVEKRRELANALFTNINSLSPTANDFARLAALHTNGAIDMIAEMQGDDRIREIFAGKFKLAGLALIDDIDTTVSGISDLKVFHRTYLEDRSGSILTAIFEHDNGTSDGFEAIERAFTRKLEIVGTNILNTFSANLPDLQRLIDFKTSEEYNFIEPKVSNFDTQTDTKIDSIRRSIITANIASYSPDETGLDDIIAFIDDTANYRLLDSGDGSLDTAYNEKAREILVAILSDTTRFPDDIPGIAAMISFTTDDARYTRFHDAALQREFEKVLSEKQARVRSGIMTSSYPSIMADITRTARALGAVPAADELRKLLSPTQDKLSDVVTAMGLTSDEPEENEDYNGIPFEIRKNTFTTLRRDKLI